MFFKEKKVIMNTGEEDFETDCFMNTVSIGRRFAASFFLTPKAIADGSATSMAAKPPQKSPASLFFCRMSRRPAGRLSRFMPAIQFIDSHYFELFCSKIFIFRDCRRFRHHIGRTHGVLNENSRQVSARTPLQFDLPGGVRCQLPANTELSIALRVSPKAAAS